jgi:hypothetical protein
MYYQDEDDELLPLYRVASFNYEWRRVEPAITINGRKITRYKAPVVREYVDMRTGEIIPAKDLRNNPEVWPTVHFSENALRREAVLASLHPQVRDLALFILAFRNYRRGVTPGVSKLVEWYALLHGKRPSNVRRNVKTLEEAGVLDGDSLLGPLFQYSGKKANSKMHRGEDGVAALKYLEMSLCHYAGPLPRPSLSNDQPQTSASTACFHSTACSNDPCFDTVVIAS